MAGKIKWYGNRVFTLATEANVVAMKKAAYLVESYVKTHFSGVDVAGEKARRAKGGKAEPGGISPRSKPGQPPAVQIGTLMSSIMSEVELSGTNVDGRVGPDVEKIAKALRKRGAKADIAAVNYGLYLEMGTSKMAPRPFLRPALRRTKRKVVKIFKDANK